MKLLPFSSSKVYSVVTSLVLIGAGLFSFQNCSRAKFTPVGIVDSASVGNNFCTTNPNDSQCQSSSSSVNCTFNAASILNGQSVMAYQNSSVPYGSTCVGESRKCTSGALSGSYSYASCQVGQPKACLFNGQTILSGQAIPAYQNSTVAYGANCLSESRVCTDGVLSGSYAFGSCQVNAATACLFNGVTLAHGQSAMAYLNSNVAYGQSCAQESRTCFNGSLSGSYNNASCTVGAASACNFNGQTIANGQNVIGYQNSSVAYGQTCAQQTRTCANGSLSGSYNFSSCAVNGPNACNFNGQNIADGQNVIAYQNSSVAFGSTCQAESRSCSNGSLSGSYSYNSCSVGAAAACLFNGSTIADGQSVIAFVNSSVPYGSSCISESRVCGNGILSGSYVSSTCNVASAASCTFDGQSIAHGQSVVAYTSSSVAFGSLCSSVQTTRTCSNGILTGSSAASYGSCVVGKPSACNFNGQTIGDSSSVTAYAASQVAYGENCIAESRSCSNGNLSGSYGNSSCFVQNPNSCNFNGQIIPHGSGAVAYAASSVPYGANCQSETRVCNNGNLGGSYGDSSCAVAAASSCNFNGQVIGHGGQVTAYATSSVAYGSSCQAETRSCNNGNLTGSFGSPSCSVAAPTGRCACREASSDGACSRNAHTVYYGPSTGVHTELNETTCRFSDGFSAGDCGACHWEP